MTAPSRVAPRLVRNPVAGDMLSENEISMANERRIECRLELGRQVSIVGAHEVRHRAVRLRERRDEQREGSPMEVAGREMITDQIVGTRCTLTAKLSPSGHS